MATRSKRSRGNCANIVFLSGWAMIGNKALAHEFEEQVLGPGEDVIVGKFHDEVRASREGQLLAPGPDLAEEAVGDVDLRARQDRDVDIFAQKRGRKPVPGLVENAEVREIEIPFVQMRRPAMCVMPSSRAIRAIATAWARSLAPSSRPGRIWQWRSIIPGGGVFPGLAAGLCGLRLPRPLLAFGESRSIHTGNSGSTARRRPGGRS